jgi:hypothetical protein
MRGYSLQTDLTNTKCIYKHTKVMQIRRFRRWGIIKKKAIFRVGRTDVLKRFYLRTARGESDLNDAGQICSARSYIMQHSVRAADSKLG